jgi:hypothetical protein
VGRGGYSHERTAEYRDVEPVSGEYTVSSWIGKYRRAAGAGSEPTLLYEAVGRGATGGGGDERKEIRQALRGLS